jgi:hypothetical protein
LHCTIQNDYAACLARNDVRFQAPAATNSATTPSKPLQRPIDKRTRGSERDEDTRSQASPRRRMATVTNDPATLPRRAAWPATTAGREHNLRLHRRRPESARNMLGRVALRAGRGAQGCRMLSERAGDVHDGRLHRLRGQEQRSADGDRSLHIYVPGLECVL